MLWRLQQGMYRQLPSNTLSFHPSQSFYGLECQPRSWHVGKVLCIRMPFRISQPCAMVKVHEKISAAPGARTNIYRTCGSEALVAAKYSCFSQFVDSLLANIDIVTAFLAWAKCRIMCMKRLSFVSLCIFMSCLLHESGKYPTNIDFGLKANLYVAPRGVEHK